MTHLTKIAKSLRNNAKRGITAERLAQLTGVSKDSVYKRIHDLRNSGTRVTDSVRTVNGRNTKVYRIAV